MLLCVELLKWRTCLMFNVYYRVSIKEDMIWNLQGHSEKGKRYESLNCDTKKYAEYIPVWTQ